MPNFFDKVLMTNRYKFRVENIGHSCFFVVGTWLSNLWHYFSNPLSTFSPKMESLRKRKKSYENQGRKVGKKWQPDSKRASGSFFSSFL